MIRSRLFSAALQAEFVWAATVAKNSRNGAENPRLPQSSSSITGLQDLDIAHVRAGDVDGRIERSVEQQLDILGLRETRQDAFDASASGASGDPSSIRHHIAPGRMTGEVQI
jgi:hypothetical protein